MIMYDDIQSIDINNITFANEVISAGYPTSKSVIDSYTDYESDTDTYGGKAGDEMDNKKSAQEKLTNAQSAKSCFSCKNKTSSTFINVKRVDGESGKSSWFLITSCNGCHKHKSTKVSKVIAEVLVAGGKKLEIATKKHHKKRTPKSK